MRMCHVFKAYFGVTTTVILLDLEMTEFASLELELWLCFQNLFHFQKED